MRTSVLVKQVSNIVISMDGKFYKTASMLAYSHKKLKSITEIP